MHATAEPPPDRTSRAIAASLVLAAFLPYAATLAFGYVLDDTTVIRSNPHLTGWDSLWKVWTQPYGGLSSHYSGLYRPLTMSLFALVWNAGGHWAIWFHLLAVVAHALATVLVWKLLARALDRWPAALAAAWFAVHPVHVEAVANVANSAEVLVAVWTCALALLLLRERSADASRGIATAMLAGALYIAAFLTKESGAMAAVLAALAWWGWRRPGDPARDERSARRVFPVLVAFGAAALLVFALRAQILGNPVVRESIAAAGLDELSAPQRIWAMLALAPKILGLLIRPGATNPHYGPTVLASPSANLLAALTVVVGTAIVVAAVRLARRGDRRVLVGIGWAIVAFLPASNLLVPTGQILAERTLYVPSIGVAMLAGVALQWVITRWGSLPARGAALRWGAIAAAVILLATLATQTKRSARAWRTNAEVFAQMIAADSAGYRGYWLAALEARHQGRTDDALAMLGRAHALYPRDRGLLMDYSTMLTDRGQHARAASVAFALMQWPALRTDPYSVGLYLNALGNAYGADSVIAAARRLMADAPSPVAARYLDEALRIRR